MANYLPLLYSLVGVTKPTIIASADSADLAARLSTARSSDPLLRTISIERLNATEVRLRWQPTKKELRGAKAKGPKGFTRDRTRP